MVFPILNRFNQGKWDTYTDVYSVMYGLGLPTKIKWTMGFNGPYIHNEFEKSILKSKLYLHRFILMVEGLARTLFVDSYISGTKLLIYASTKEMCTLLSAYLSEELPELIGMSDRMLIFKNGDSAKEILRDPEIKEKDVIQ